MITQSLFLLPSSKPLRVATLYPWRKDAAQTDTGDRAGRAICMGVVPIQAATGVPVGEMAAHLAIGVAPGVTAVTRRSTEGIRTGRGIRPRPSFFERQGRLSGRPFYCGGCSGPLASRQIAIGVRPLK
jgi:hypothetical protein